MRYERAPARVLSGRRLVEVVVHDAAVPALAVALEFVGVALRSGAAREHRSDGGAVRLVEGEAEDLPFDDGSFDVVVSNGVIDLVPDKDAVFSEILRVLRPGGRIQIADVTIQNPVSEEGRRNIDLWTG